jgi:hypothetical protein
MKTRASLLVSVITTFSIALWLAEVPQAEAGIWDYCCVELQGQFCFHDFNHQEYNYIDCNWGAYGAGYCYCTPTRRWECYSLQPMPGTPTEPICY